MTFFRPFFALLQGLKLCFFTPEVRKLALWPWCIGCVSYFLSLYAVYAAHPTVMAWFVSSPSGILAYAKYILIWIGVSALMLLLAIILSICFVMICTSAFQSSIAQAALLAHDVRVGLPEMSILNEASRTILVETKKLFWLLPLMIFVFIASFIPFLAPFAILLGAWLLAFQFVDVVLDLFRLSASQRLAFARANYLSLVCFGLVLGALWTVPFLGIFLAPAATAGAAWFLSEPEFMSKIQLLAAESNGRGKTV